MEVVVLFQSTHEAMATQKELLHAHIPFRVIPTPKDISSHCGIALLISQADVERASLLLSHTLATGKLSFHQV